MFYAVRQENYCYQGLGCLLIKETLQVLINFQQQPRRKAMTICAERNLSKKCHLLSSNNPKASKKYLMDFIGRRTASIFHFYSYKENLIAFRSPKDVESWKRKTKSIP